MDGLSKRLVTEAEREEARQLVANAVNVFVCVLFVYVWDYHMHLRHSGGDHTTPHAGEADKKKGSIYQPRNSGRAQQNLTGSEKWCDSPEKKSLRVLSPVLSSRFKARADLRSAVAGGWNVRYHCAYAAAGHQLVYGAYRRSTQERQFAGPLRLLLLSCRLRGQDAPISEHDRSASLHRRTRTQKKSGEEEPLHRRSEYSCGLTARQRAWAPVVVVVFAAPGIYQIIVSVAMPAGGTMPPPLREASALIFKKGDTVRTNSRPGCEGSSVTIAWLSRRSGHTLAAALDTIVYRQVCLIITHPL